MLKIKGLKKSFGNVEVLKEIDLELKEGQIGVILGPSGTGKSTLLRCINYLEEPEKGTISIDGYKVNFENIRREEIIELRKKTSMVFQNYNLLKHRTAIENIMEPMIVVHKKPKEESYSKAIELLEQVGLVDKKDYYPIELSGGQQQRIAIARSIASDSKLILLDEPTSSLDPGLVGEVLDVIKDLAKQDRTMLIVTHELEFAKDIADKIIFLNNGYVMKECSSQEFFEDSCNSDISKFK